MLFETGYGPSGLPHIGTFGEVARTTMIRRAFEAISRHPDPADLLFRRHGRDAQGAGQRAATRTMLRENLQRPLTSVPDPFGEYESFGGAQQRHAAAVSRHLRVRVRVHLARPNSTAPGRFDAVLLRAAERYDAIMEVMLAAPARGAAADLFDLPADLARVPAGCSTCR